MRRSFPYLLAGVLLCVGCSLTSFQTPEVLPPSRGSVSLGIEYYPGIPIPLGEVSYRHGLSSSVDIGGKLGLPWPSLSADVKCQLLKKPLLMAFDFGGSYSRVPPLPDQTDYDTDIFTMYPELIVGSQRIYGAIRPLMLYSVEHDVGYQGTRTSTIWFPQIFIGGAIGRKFVVMPEVMLGYLNSEPGGFVSGFGVAFQWRP